MIRLLYCSQSAPRKSDDQDRNILLSSRQNNKALGITGVLVHGGDMYMQVLEGPERAVLGLYLKILDDRRHGGCQLIYITPTKEKIFEAWSMGVINSDPMAFECIAELHAHGTEAVSGKAFKDLMYAFTQMLVKK